MALKGGDFTAGSFARGADGAGDFLKFERSINKQPIIHFYTKAFCASKQKRYEALTNSAVFEAKDALGVQAIHVDNHIKKR